MDGGGNKDERKCKTSVGDIVCSPKLAYLDNWSRVDKTWKHWKHASGTFESKTHTNKQPDLIINKIYMNTIKDY